MSPSSASTIRTCVQTYEQQIGRVPRHKRYVPTAPSAGSTAGSTEQPPIALSDEELQYVAKLAEPMITRMGLLNPARLAEAKAQDGMDDHVAAARHRAFKELERDGDQPERKLYTLITGDVGFIPKFEYLGTEGSARAPGPCRGEIVSAPDLGKPPVAFLIKHSLE